MTFPWCGWGAIAAFPAAAPWIPARHTSTNQEAKSATAAEAAPRFRLPPRSFMPSMFPRDANSDRLFERMLSKLCRGHRSDERWVPSLSVWPFDMRLMPLAPLPRPRVPSCQRCRVTDTSRPLCECYILFLYHGAVSQGGQTPVSWQIFVRSTKNSRQRQYCTKR